MAHAAKPAVGLKLKRILYATDYSPASERALRFARAIARAYDSTIYVLHVMPPPPRYEVPMDTMEEEVRMDREVALGEMGEFVNAARFSGVNHRELVERGSIPFVFDTVVRDHDIDLVVMGTAGRGGLKKILLGSVAEQVFRTVACPVLTVGPHVRCDVLTDNSFHHVVCAIDLSERSLGPLAYAASLAGEYMAKFTVLHVLPFVSLEFAVPDDEPFVRAAITRMRAMMPASSCEAEYAVHTGAVVPSILAFAEKNGADLLVIGTHQSHTPALTSHVPWAVAHEVVAHSGCPVLSVRT